MNNIADNYLKNTLLDIKHRGVWSKNPRTKWTDGTPAHYKQVRQRVYDYNILKGDFPITTLRTTALKGCFYEMEWIYLKQSNIIEEAHPSIHSWWKDFVVMKNYNTTRKGGKVYTHSDIGKTYGHIVKKYSLMDKLLYDMEHNWESRRLNMDLWQEENLNSNPKPLPPCAYRTDWSVDEVYELVDYSYSGKSNGSPIYETKKYIDFNLSQRSRDLLMTASINPSEYVMLAMMIANHLTFKTGITHKVRHLQHIVFNEHIYDRHLEAMEEVLNRESTGIQPTIELVCEPKSFYEHTIEDFKFSGLKGIKKLNSPLELAI